ncbi:MAG: monofunctional biosynthetic peptidoglycan transglycosylase [Bacteroidota bacterium]
MAVQIKKVIKKLWKIIKVTFLTMFLSSLVYIIIGKWVIPPTTITQMVDSYKYGIYQENVSWNHISSNVKLAAIASEDQLFLEHSGFDWNAIEKSLKPPKKGRKSKRPPGSGASTISQQVAKNVFLWQGTGWTRYFRKLPEMYFTKMIELVWGKKRIMEVYLNVIEMGPGIYGIEAAAQSNFNKKASQLNAEQAAQIVACFPNPKKFFVVHPQSRRVAWRYPQIIREMNNLRDDEDIDDFLKN